MTSGPRKFFAELTTDDLPAGVTAARFTGTYPIGRKGRKGRGGGSPFAIRDHACVDPQHGSQEEAAAAVQRLHAQGVAVIFELSPNHLALDADLLELDPELFVHTVDEPQDKNGYFLFERRPGSRKFWIRHGGYLYDNARFFWDDTLQLDLSNPRTRAAVVGWVKTLVRSYCIDGFRVDMAYQLLNGPFEYRWHGELRQKMGEKIEDEFLAQLIAEVKQEFPHVAFIAEGFYRWERLSAVGFDVIYSKNEMDLPGGYHHTGWYNALQRRDIWEIRDAISRAAFLNWQKGGAGMLAFVGHHDLPSPWECFGDWVWGATFLTLMLPTTRNWYAGTEAGFQDPGDENGKMIAFSKDVQIDWRGIHSDYGRFVSDVLGKARKIAEILGPAEMEPLIPEDQSLPWVGYLLQPADGAASAAQALVLANLAHHPVEVRIHRPDLGLPNFCRTLCSCGQKGQELVLIARD